MLCGVGKERKERTDRETRKCRKKSKKLKSKGDLGRDDDTPAYVCGVEQKNIFLSADTPLGGIRSKNRVGTFLRNRFTTSCGLEMSSKII